MDPTPLQLQQNPQYFIGGESVNARANLLRHNKSFVRLPVDHFLYRSFSPSDFFVLSFISPRRPSSSSHTLTHTHNIHSLSSIGQCNQRSASDKSLGDESVSRDSLSQFDVLGLQHLRQGLLHPQGREATGRVVSPALRHQLSHLSQTLETHTEEYTLILLNNWTLQGEHEGLKVRADVRPPADIDYLIYYYIDL